MPHQSATAASGVFGDVIELISYTPSLKLRLVMLTFLLLGIPTSVAINSGLPEGLALKMMLGVLLLAALSAGMISTRIVSSLRPMTDDDPSSATILTLELSPDLRERLHRATSKRRLRSPHKIALKALEAWLDRNEQEHKPLAVEHQIERLYDEIIALAQKGPAEASTIELAYARLLELQTAEAQHYRERFEASLNMPIDAGEQILARARTLREELENLTSSDAAVQDINKP